MALRIQQAVRLPLGQPVIFRQVQKSRPALGLQLEILQIALTRNQPSRRVPRTRLHRLGLRKRQPLPRLHRVAVPALADLPSFCNGHPPPKIIPHAFIKRPEHLRLQHLVLLPRAQRRQRSAQIHPPQHHQKKRFLQPRHAHLHLLHAEVERRSQLLVQRGPAGCFWALAFLPGPPPRTPALLRTSVLV